MFMKKVQNSFEIVFLSDMFSPLTVKDFEETVDECLMGKTWVISFQNLFGFFLDLFSYSLKKAHFARSIRLVTKFHR